MLKLNIKNLWMQQMGNDERPVEIKVVEDVSIEFEGDEVQFYNKMIEKIVKDLEGQGKSWQESWKEEEMELPENWKEVETELPEEWDMDCEIPEMECEDYEEENSMDLDEELDEELSELEDEPKEIKKKTERLSVKMKKLI